MDQQAQVKHPSTAAQLRARLKALNKLGVRNSQLRVVLGLSYTGIHRLSTGDIRPADHKLPEYHKRLTDWCRRVAKC